MTAPRSPYERRRLIATVATTVATAWWLHSILGDDEATPTVVYVQQFTGPADAGPVLEPSTFSTTERLLPSGRIARGGGGTFGAVR